ncbi:MAG: alpha/beta hydrolase [Methanolinea sp.]|nr:alpha/beta hydrolase [Methanolinea sp.]
MPDRVFRPAAGELLLVRGRSSFLVAGQAGSRFSICIETPGGEHCQSIWPHHVIAVSAPEGGSLSAAAMLFCLVRDHRVPLLVLPRDHPGCRRVRYVVSAGERILLSCTIARGTHPEQDVLCSSEEMGGMSLEGETRGIRVAQVPPGVDLSVIPLPVKFLEGTADTWPPVERGVRREGDRVPRDGG